MPCSPSHCLPRRARIFIATLRSATFITLVSLTSPAQAEQLWSVYGLGIKVGELRVEMSESSGIYRGAAQFHTTGLIGLFARVRFDVASDGLRDGNKYVPKKYTGNIDTGRRQSITSVDFSGQVPLSTSGTSKPDTPIPDEALHGAIDPMTMLWITVRDHTAETLCTQNRTQFDGTRLVSISLTSRTRSDDTITCSGSYNRLYGYTAKEISDLPSSPVSVTYQNTGDVWRAVEIRVKTRHGPASLSRRN